MLTRYEVEMYVGGGRTRTRNLFAPDHAEAVKRAKAQVRTLFREEPLNVMDVRTVPTTEVGGLAPGTPNRRP